MEMQFTKLMRIVRYAGEIKRRKKKDGFRERRREIQERNRKHKRFAGRKTPPGCRGRSRVQKRTVLAALLSAEGIASAAAQKENNPDPVTSAMFTSSASASAAVSKITAAAAQNQNQPDQIAAVSSCITAAVTVTSTVCCC